MSRQAATEQPAPQLSGGRRGQGTETPPHTHLPVCTVCTTAETGSSLTRSESFPSLDSYLQRELEVRSYLQKELEVKSARVRARVYFDGSLIFHFLSINKPLAHPALVLVHNLYPEAEF